MIIAKLKENYDIDRFSQNPVYDVVEFGIDTITFEKVELPQCDPRLLGAYFYENINAWIVPSNWKEIFCANTRKARTN